MTHELLIDEETGEILGEITPADELESKFEINTAGKADWVLSKMFAAESAISALQSQKEAMIDNYDSMIADHARKLQGLHFRFDNELAHFANDTLLKLPHGRVEFRTSKGGLRVTDKALALEWAKTNAPEAVVTKQEFQISALTNKSAAESAPGFEVVNDTRKFYIKTGVAK